MLISGRISTETKNQADFLSEVIDRQKQQKAEREKLLNRQQALATKNEKGEKNAAQREAAALAAEAEEEASKFTVEPLVQMLGTNDKEGMEQQRQIMERNLKNYEKHHEKVTEQRMREKKVDFH
jgi:regulator of protease activity HflC (stomatin/prohibitin superfamily)